jgi:hypothetical protein
MNELDLSTASYVGPAITDEEILAALPVDYRGFLKAVNGCVLFSGGLHIRGASADPEWHSLRRVWKGEDALSGFCPAVERADIPFAQDVLGDQFLLRDERLVRLDGETGDIAELEIGWREFLSAAQRNPQEFLSLNRLAQFHRQGGIVRPGQLLSVYPPLCTEESANGVSVRTTPALERIRFLANFAAQIRDVAEGGKVRVVVDR